MKINSLKICLITIVFSLFVACSSKDDSISYNDEDSKVYGQNIENVENTDDKLSKIETVDSDIESIDNNSKFGDSYLNRVTSNINGEDITLVSIHFDFNKFNIKNEMLDISNNNAVKINEVISKYSNVKVKVEGNCDEWGNDEYNFALGLKRAKAVKTSLINNGVKSSNIIILSLGESNPICNEKTADCWKQNRRVDHLLLP